MIDEDGYRPNVASVIINKDNNKQEVFAPKADTLAFPTEMIRGMSVMTGSFASQREAQCQCYPRVFTGQGKSGKPPVGICIACNDPLQLSQTIGW